ncbi:hypothetical protein [Rhizobium binxianense]
MPRKLQTADPSQPALIDEPDGKDRTIPAILVGTKRGQIFYLNRETGEPLARVEERPVPQEPRVPDETTLSPTQPFSFPRECQPSAPRISPRATCGGQRCSIS